MIMTVSSAKQVHQLKYHLGLKELCISWRRESLPTQMSILGVISEPAQLRPGPSAVRNQRCCAPDSWRAAPRPHHSTPRIPQCIQYKLCVLVYQCVQGSAPSYLQNAICPVVSAESRRHLRSASSADLIVPATRRTTMGDGAFAIAALCVWNSLPVPDAIRRSPSLAIIKRSLKTHFYIQCFY